MKKNLTIHSTHVRKSVSVLALAFLFSAFPFAGNAGSSSPDELPGKTQTLQSNNRSGEYVLRKDQIVCSFLPITAPSMQLICIDRDKKETRVTVAVPVTFDDQWFRFDSNFSIRNIKNGDIYRIRSLTRDIPLNQKFFIDGMRGRMVEFTMIFPPLPSKVKVVDIYEYSPNSAEYHQEQGYLWHMKNITVKAYRPTKQRKQYYYENGTPKTSRDMEFQNLTEDQIVLSPTPVTSGPTIQRIETTNNETRVTVAVPIHWDRNWVSHSKGFCMVDSKRGKVYQIKSLTRGIELNKIVWINGYRGKVVEFTMVFPPLKSNVKYIHLYTKYPEEGTLLPLDAGKPWQWYNIRVKDYEQQVGKIIY